MILKPFNIAKISYKVEQQNQVPSNTQVVSDQMPSQDWLFHFQMTKENPSNFI